MLELLQKCTVCEAPFHVRFGYQMEERTVAGSAGDETQFRFYCSQACVQNSHRAKSAATCSACGSAFQVSQAAQVLYLGGKRNYACAESCRKQLLEEARGVRLGELVRPVQGTEAPGAQDPARNSATDTSGVGPESAVNPSFPLDSPNVAPGGEPSDAALSEHSESPRIIAVFNHKGGTGKTTTSVTLAAGLAARGFRTLLVDTDAQGNVAVSLGLKTPRSLYHVLVMGLRLEDCVVTARPNLDVLPSNETLAAAELYLAGRKHRDRVLQNRLANVRDQYDYIVVDCSPSLSLLNQNALVFAEGVLCPVACDYLSLVGVRQVVKTIKNINRHLAHPVQLWGVLPTMYDGRARICREALDTLREHFGDRCLAPVRNAIRVKEAPAQAKTLLEYAADSSSASDYLLLINRVINSKNEAAQLAATA